MHVKASCGWCGKQLCSVTLAKMEGDASDLFDIGTVDNGNGTATRHLCSDAAALGTNIKLLFSANQPKEQVRL